MKKICVLLLLFISFLDSSATHTKGGWMYYEYLGPGIQDPTKLRYRVGLNFYMDCPSAVFENTFIFSIFDGAQPHFLLNEISVPVVQDNNVNN